MFKDLKEDTALMNKEMGEITEDKGNCKKINCNLE